MSDRQDLNTSALNLLKQYGGEDRVKKILNLYLGHVPEMIELLRNALGEGDHQTLKRTAHTLKSSAGPVGAEILYDLVRQIEDAASEGDDQTLTILVPQIEPAFLRTKELIESMD